MRLTLLGHASIFVETHDCRVLMDPVLWDPHQEGLFNVYPPREILHREIPPFDILVISHRHLDHLDVRSLAHLPRDVTVVLPRDPVVEETVRALGYSDVVPLDPLVAFDVGTTRFLTTASTAPVTEFGLVVHDPTGACWNVVDTHLDAATIAAVHAFTPRIDALLAPWQPMLEVEYQWNGSLGFPARAYSQMLAHVAAIAPRAVVPGSNGFRYRDASAWMNRVVFPVSRERFCADVERPGVAATHPMDPGDVLEMVDGASKLVVGGASFVRRLAPYGDDLRFVPVDFDGRLVDPNPDAVPSSVLQEVVEREMEVDLPRFLASSDASRWRPHVERGALQQIDVVFPEQRSSWVVDFTSKTPLVRRGGSGRATMGSLITGSALHGLITATRTWDYAIMGGFYRRFQSFESAPALPDPLRVRFPSHPLQKAVLAQEVARWSGARPLSAGRGGLRIEPYRLPEHPSRAPQGDTP